MKKITKITYKSFFGYYYDSEEECWRHEKIMNDVLDILNSLKVIPDDLSLDWYNKGGFIQQDINVVNDVRSRFLLYLKELINKKPFQEHYANTIDSIKCGKDLLGIFYYLDWTDYRYLMTPIDRLVCTDKKGREYAKQFFMLNPKERKHKKLN
jgi:hypothetical protein